MLYKFLLENEKEILENTAKKTSDLAGDGPSSEQLKKGLPIFFKQLVSVLKLELGPDSSANVDKPAMVKAANEANEPAMSVASGRIDEVAVAEQAGLHGVELLRLGYTLSHVVHAYGAMCQAITELASQKKSEITALEFRDLNECLDVAMAGAVTQYASQKTTDQSNRETEHLGALAHELRNALNSATLAFDLIKSGTVTPGGSTGKVLVKSLSRLDQLIDRSLTEVRLKVDPEVHPESAFLFQVVDQILLTANVEAKKRNQSINVSIKADVEIDVDQQLFHSAVSNIIQNSLKYSKDGAHIEIRGKIENGQVVLEVEDECGGLSEKSEKEMFEPFKRNSMHTSGLGLGLSIAQRAVKLNHGTLEVHNVPGHGCIMEIHMPVMNH